MELLYEAINEKLVDAVSVCLVSDIWTNKQMLDFLVLSANIINNNFEKKAIVIGMMLMPGNHCAENIKIAIEELVNRYSFDKSKIHG